MTQPSKARVGVLFVCMGNICRSPMARVIFENMVAERVIADRFDIDSCGTGGWHEGGDADARAAATIRRYGLTMQHTARQLRPGTDFGRFRWLLVMDRQNRDGVLEEGADPSHVRLMRSFDPALAGLNDDRLEVPDPYHGPGDGFENVYQMLVAACAGFLAHLGY